MTFDVKKLEGVRIAVGASKNSGAKWSWKVLSEIVSMIGPGLGWRPMELPM
jgi:hypothetical protein